MIIHDGISQDRRHPIPLKPGYFNVAEMDLKRLLAYGMDYARLIHYYNSANQRQGQWSFLFSGDDTMVLAHICATDMAHIEADFQKACRRPAHLRASAAVRQAAHSHRLALRLNTWYVCLATATSKAGIRVRDLLAETISRQLSRYLRGLAILLEQYPPRLIHDHHIDFDAFAPAWGIGSDSAPQVADTQSHPTARRGTADAANLLQDCFNTFRNATALVMQTAADNFSLAMARQDHDPAVALYIAFIQLFVQAQHKINQFTPQHLNYYYRDLLQIAPSGPKPDSAFIVLRLDGSLAQVTIPRGTAFSAGKDADGHLINYRADNDLLVTGTRVTRLATLCFEKNRLMSPEKELDYVTNVWLATFPPSEPESLSKGEAPAPRPLFGASAGGSEIASGAPAGLGLAVADPVLLLGQGKRDITVSIDFDTASSNLPADIIERIKDWSGTTVHDAFFKIFKQMFTIHLTTDAGWYELENYLPDAAPINPDLPPDRLCLYIQLSPDEPPIVPCRPALHGKAYEAGLPILRLDLNPGSDLYAYSLLQTWMLRQIRIEVAVNGYKDLLVYNQHGQLDPTAPFDPFGPLPDTASYLMVGGYETAFKKLTALAVALTWATLPGGRDGMQAYYRGYDQPYRPDLYEMRAALLSDGRWYPGQPDDQPLVKLFQPPGKDENPSEGVSTRSVLAAWHLAQHIPVAAGSVDKKRFAFNLDSRSGFFKFTLARPEYGFGHRAYPQLLSQALSANILKKKDRPLPKSPYTPKVSAISLNYRAETVINMEKGMAEKVPDTDKRLYHLHPLGWERIYPPLDNRPRPLVPDHDHPGNLFIGLAGSKPAGALTLFFHLRPQAVRSTRQRNKVPKWYYLSANQWTELHAGRVISDSTGGFIHSGIVTLDIPDRIDRENTILPDDCYWLRVSVDGDCQADTQIFGAAAQALQVTLDLADDAPDLPGRALPAGTINRAATALPGIGGVFQPVASVNGRAGETEERLAVRAGERLRHKNRAVTAWDYERLVLERFPEIYKAKCFAGVDPARGFGSGGRVLLVVIARRDTGVQSPEQQPMADAELLESIRDHVATLASPFASIDVCNPTYEGIQIRCAVKLQPSVGAGAALKRINDAIRRYLSPWTGQGRYQARFGWCIRRADIESYLLSLEDVAYVTGFSMLHIVRYSDDRYSLFDTAGKLDATRHVDDIHPRYPWSIAVPMRDHHIRTIGDYQSIAPQSAGIDDITIGETFIVSGT